MAQDNFDEVVKEYAELAKDKHVDAASLMINALEQRDQNKLSLKTKRWAYLISIALPPFGLGFAMWFFFREETDAKTTAFICVALTLFSFGLTILFLNVILQSSGTSVEQIQQIKPEEIYQLIE
jgi:peptidoglycan/LPS O-acetylase OafA/YrhL